MRTVEHPPDEDLSAYLDAALPDEDLAWIREHLVCCAGCRADLDTLASLRRDLASLPPLLPSPAFVARVMAVLPVAPVPVPAHSWRRAALRGGAVLLLSVLVLAGLQLLAGGHAIALLVRVLALPALLCTWCIQLLMAFPSGDAVPVLAPVVGVLLGCIVSLGAVLRLVLLPAPAERVGAVPS